MLVVAAHAAVLAVVDAGLVEGRLDDALRSATGGEYGVEVGSARASLLGRSLRLADVRVGPPASGTARSSAVTAGGGNERGDRRASGRGAAAVGIEVSVDTLEADGVGWTGLLGNPRVEADLLRLAGVDVRLARPAGGRAGAGGEGTRGEVVRNGRTSLPVRLHRAVPPIEVGLLRLERARIRIEAGDGPDGGVLLEGLSAALSDVRSDSAAARDTARLVLARSLRAALDRGRWVSADGLTTLEATAATLSSEDSVLAAEGLRLGPMMTDREFFERLERRRDRRRLAVARLDARGLDVRRLVREGAVVARSARFDSLQVDVLSDRTVPEGGGRASPEASAEDGRGDPLPLGRVVSLDTVRIRGGARYAEIAPGAAGPGSVTFDELYATAYGFASDSVRDASGRPSVLDVRTRVFGEIPLEVSFRLPPGGPGFRLDYRGSAGPFDASLFNALLVPLEGMRFESGRVDSLWFEVAVRGDTATGRVEGRYRDLSIAMVDRASGEGGLLDDVKSFLANTFVLKGESAADGDSARSGAVGDRVGADDAFFELVWHAFRTGLMDLLGV